MPTSLPQPTPLPPPASHELRAILIAAALLLGVNGLLCCKFLPPWPGYSLAASAQDLQLSP